MAQGLDTAVLGRTELQVTRLGYGAMEVWGEPKRGPISEEDVGKLLNAVLDAGINFIDTARAYGKSEERIGRHLSHRRSEFFLATKGHIFSKEALLQGLDESLHQLKTDYVDVFQLHNPPVEQCEEEDLVEALQEMRRQGKVRWLGISTTLPHLPTYVEWGVFDEFQIPYSALQREHEEWISKSAEAGIGTVIRGGVAQGEPGEGRGGEESWRNFEEANLDELREEGESRSAFVLRLTLTHPDIHTIITGTKNPAHLQENVEAAQRGPLPADTYEETKRRLDEVGVKPAEGS